MSAVQGACAFVTGGASGIGLGMARALAAAGADICVADIEPEGVARAVAELSGGDVRVHGLVADVSSLVEMERARQEVEATLGTVDILANNAGVVFNAAPLWETPPEMVDWNLAVNVVGVYNGVRTFVPGMIERGHGHVVNTSSIGGFQVRKHPVWHQGLYAATKYAVVALSEGLAHDLEHAGIKVSVLAPAWVATQIGQSDRNRPERFGGPAKGSQSEKSAEEMAGGMDPLAVGEHVVDAITHERMYVFTHPDQRDVVAARHESIMRGFAESQAYVDRTAADASAAPR